MCGWPSWDRPCRSASTSPAVICTLDFPDRLERLLDRMSVPSGAIGLEIAESVAMHDLDATSFTLVRLRLKGFSVAIDDFGTGR